MKTALRPYFYHEIHHIYRGWTIEGNKFEKGIDIAAINEELAEVFTELHTGLSFEIMKYPDDVNEWVNEVLLLPEDANYNHWMNVHPDGRIAIAYKVGTYLVRIAMKKTNMSIIELSEKTPSEIIDFAGY